MNALPMFAALIAAHALCDYPLQGDFLARAKNPRLGFEGVPWWWGMGAHAAIHGGAVGLTTGVWWLGVCEAAAHSVIDFLKCTGRFGSGERAFSIDQGLHIVCKVAWVSVVLAVGR